jgi:flagellar protein FliJ
VGDYRGVRDPGFRFRLERVHWLRRQSERSAQEALAASLGRQLDSERALGELDARIETAHGAERAAAGGAGERPLRSGEELVAMEAYLGRLEGSRAAAAQALRERVGQVEDDRRRLLAAASARQALDRLRGRRLGEHRRAAARAEGAQLDELALAGHRRRRVA